ncbi:hypothetical protein ACFVTZ_10435 [Cellulosimicrobium cellulans]|uniref:hypothetical protein n=1 Tax=Cellulosimicrobium cellulans TaxID=1710 RepID=UPI0036EA855E
MLELVRPRALAPAFVALFSTPAGEQLHRSEGFGRSDMVRLLQMLDPARSQSP